MLLRAYALLGIPAGLIAGLSLGLVANRDDGWGGYDSFARRAARLGHVAAVMLPAIAGLYAVLVSPLVALPAGATPGIAASSESLSDAAAWGAALWIGGGVTLPLLLFAAAWRRRLASFLPVPALAVVAGALFLAAAALHGGRP